MGISAYSATPGSNTTINGINIAEGCNASNINDAIRQLMADIKAAGLDALGPLVTLTSAADKLPYFTGVGTAATTTFTVAGRAIVAVADVAAFDVIMGIGSMAHRNGTISASAPSGGADGDVWFKY